MSPVTEKEDPKVLELAQKMTGKEKAEQLQMLRAYMQEHLGVQDEQPQFVLSKEAVRMIADGAIDAAKKTAKEEITEVERKYNLNAGQTNELIDTAVGKEKHNQKHYMRDREVAANLFRTIARAGTNQAQQGELSAGYEEERKYLKETGREVRAMTAGTGSAGGYLAPEIWNTMVYENLARVSFLRRFGKWMPMPENVSGIMRLPKLTTNVAAPSTTPSEAGAIAATQPVFAQATWTLKKLAILSNAISMEMLYEATPYIVDALVNWATIELNRKEDEITFSTSDATWSQYLLNSSTNTVTMGTGKTALTDVTFDDMNALIFQLAEQYVPDEDVGGSGMVPGVSQFWANKAVIQQLLKLKGTDNGYLWDSINQLANTKKIGGYNVRRTLSMPSTAATGTKFMAFGNLGYMWVAYKPGFYIDFLNQGTVNSTNLNENFAYAVRVGELLDLQRIDDNAFAILKTA